MQAIGFGLAVIAQARTLVKSIEERIKNYRKGPATFRTLSANLDRSTQLLGEAERLLRGASPSALPSETCAVVQSTCTTVRDLLSASHTTMQELTPGFEGSRSRGWPKVKSMLHRGSCANAFNAKMISVETQLNNSSNELLHLISVLTLAPKIQETQEAVWDAAREIQDTGRETHDAVQDAARETQDTVQETQDAVRETQDAVRETQDAVRDTARETQDAVRETQDVVRDAARETHDALSKIKDLNIGNTSNPVYRRHGTSIPALRHTVVLNFDVRDADGELETPEGKLKHFVLSSSSSTEVTAAAGVMKPAYGVVGMGGVGKTIALQGLAYDEDIRNRFVDGVLYMSLGQGATLQKVIGEIGRIMRMTGGRVVESWDSLRDVIDEAVVWFSGKECLFLVDDLWPTANCETGYLRDLQEVLRESPKSRMAVTTRSVEIARDAGLVVPFDAREPTGSVSETLFMKYATVSLPREAYAKLDDEVRSSVMEILLLCGGLPIALAVMGCGVGNLASLHGNFKSACTSYAVDLEKKVIRIGEEKMAGCTSLNAGIILSLECLAGNWKVGAEIEHSMMDLYTSFCVLDNQEWIPVSVLRRLWQLDEGRTLKVAKRFAEMSLASLSVREGRNGCSECGLMLHDLQLEFCRRQAKEKETWSRWHGQVVDGYQMVGAGTGADASSLQDFTSFTPREWWCERVPEDGYIHRNLAKHLRCSGLGIELGALLLDARWTHVRIRIGGILALRADFEELKKFMEEGGGGEWNLTFSEDVKEGFKAILKSVQHAWGRVGDGERAFQFQLCGRLCTLRHDNEIVDAYLKSVEKNTTKPYLVPVNSFFPEHYGALQMELPLRGPVTCSPCGQYIAGVAFTDVVVVDAASGDVLQRSKGHTWFITSITFGAESTKIVSGSSDKTAVVWKWDQSDSPVHVLEGHSSAVTCVALSRDGRRIFSGSEDGTLRVWDADGGTQKGVIQPGERSILALLLRFICWTYTQYLDLMLGVFGWAIDIWPWDDDIWPPKYERISALAVCANGRSVAVGVGNGTLKVVDTDTGATVYEDANAHEERVSSMALSPNGALLVTASSNFVQMWNTETWTRIGEALEGHDNAVYSVAFSPDGQRIVSGSGDGYIRVWSVETGRTIGVSPNLHSEVRSVRFSCDGKRIISGYSDGMVRIWDAVLEAECEEREYGRSAEVLGIAISDDGMRVVSGSRDGRLRLWDSQSGAQIGVPLKGHTDAVTCVSFSLDGRLVVSGSRDYTVRLWDMETSAQMGNPLQGHSKWVQSVSFSCDGLRIVSGSDDRTVRVWKVATREQIGGALVASFGSDDVAESSDGCHIVAKGFRGSTIWNRKRRAIVWSSEGHSFTPENEMSNRKAKVVVLSCGQQTPHIWPGAFSAYTAEVYSDGGNVYSNAVGEKTLLGALPFGDGHAYWRYEPNRKVFAAGLKSGAVAICKLIQ